MMIRDRLAPAIRERFPEVAFTFVDSKQPFARVVCPCSELGELEIYDDGDEATIVLTKVTHCHVNPYSKMPSSERDAWITESVLDFLTALFEDRMLVYCSSDRLQSGSHRYETPIDRSRPVVGTEQYDCFVWSGPVATTAPDA